MPPDDLHPSPLAGFVEYPHDEENFLADVQAGLSMPQKTLPSKYFYDDAGSRLFEEITELPEYYPTRTEVALLERHAAEMTEPAGAGATLVEFGAGASKKVRLLLDALRAPAAFIPVDISCGQLVAAARALATDYPHVQVVPVCADYTQPFELPAVGGDFRLGFFPGSTIGNFTTEEAKSFLAAVATDLGPGAGLIIGADLRKDSATLCAAYNDARGVTAAFNLNLLVRINRELDADFDIGGFAHDARWNDAAGRIEMHLVSRRTQQVSLAGVTYGFRAGESILTEYSHKYTVAGFAALADAAGWNHGRVWIDSAGLFSVHWLIAR